MIYQGSKNKYANSIVPILQNLIDKNNIEVYIEPFVGGANIIDKINCPIKIGADKNYSLICLLQKAQNDLDEIPAHGSEELWYQAKDIYRSHEGQPSMEQEMEGWKIGAIQFLGSYNRGGFSRGYAKPSNGHDFYNEAYLNLYKQALTPNFKNITFINTIYDKLIIDDSKSTLIYCDPPYENTKPYGYKFETDFDYYNYWNWVREISNKHIVICSEQNFPSDFDIIWQKEVKRTMNNKRKIAIEKLGIYNKGTNGK